MPLTDDEIAIKYFLEVKNQYMIQKINAPSMDELKATAADLYKKGAVAAVFPDDDPAEW